MGVEAYPINSSSLSDTLIPYVGTIHLIMASLGRLAIANS